MILVGRELYIEFSDKQKDTQIVNEFVLENDDYTDVVNETTVGESKKEKFSIDWDKIKNTNKDVVAWIRIPKTNISYPVLKGQTNDTYIRHNIYHQYARSGSIFVSENNDMPFDDFNTIIYGHNLGNGQMFSQLKRYREQDFYKSHPYIYIYFPDETVKKYKIISFHTVNDGNASIYNLNIQDFNEYKDAVYKNNQINNMFSFKDEDVEKIITLSTCTNTSKVGRYVLHAVLVNR